ncbi:MAG: flavodoxin-dependent (E)-4-hydroxy-3-methylbut-2-enyl-diphosphate synthase [Planctomycetota bacterium]|jgi:(E)-4-hydroxy-3-methylbut-2-enyl-diphosphate synthase|nr:flavodoxin-dependent (E)-4-hydroxy-3-methylbut-2-enyl-diphosphate synthase [Planctomycetota bacterium]
MDRRKSRQVSVAGVAIGGVAPVTVQSMNRAPLEDIEANLRELAVAQKAGCDIARIAIPSLDLAAAFGKVAARSPLPLVADTHFDWRITLAAIREGANKVRINPGNMNPDGLERVVAAAGERGIPIRIGGNSGSIRSGQNSKGDATPLVEILARETLEWAERLESFGFSDIVLSLKAPTAAETVAANRLVAANSTYPLHLGVTAAGPREDAILKSAVGIGALLLDGIGDTIRFSFTGDMAGEIETGIALLKALGIRRKGVEIIACPTCGRTRVDLPGLVREVKSALGHIEKPLRVAVMGCEVNGPGEAREADIGIAAAGRQLHLFIQGEVKSHLPAAEAMRQLVYEAEKLAALDSGD